MVGVGGDRFAAEHVKRTISLLSRLPLERGDLVYLSPFIAGDPTNVKPSAALHHMVRIGLVTSESGAAVGDISHPSTRFPGFQEGPVYTLAKADVRHDPRRRP